MNKKAFDKEYATNFKREKLYLEAMGINPSFVKKDSETGICTYKFTKTVELFEALVEFHRLISKQK